MGLNDHLVPSASDNLNGNVTILATCSSRVEMPGWRSISIPLCEHHVSGVESLHPGAGGTVCPGAPQCQCSVGPADPSGACIISSSRGKTWMNVRYAVKGDPCSAATLVREPFMKTVTSRLQRMTGRVPHQLRPHVGVLKTPGSVPVVLQLCPLTVAAVGAVAVSRGLAHSCPTSQEVMELHLLPDGEVFRKPGEPQGI